MSVLTSAKAKDEMKEINRKIITIILCMGLWAPKSFAGSVGAEAGPVTVSVVFFSVSTIVAVCAWKNKKKSSTMITQETSKNPLLPVKMNELVRDRIFSDANDTPYR